VRAPDSSRILDIKPFVPVGGAAAAVVAQAAALKAARGNVANRPTDER